jgi:hypothetical protein
MKSGRDTICGVKTKKAGPIKDPAYEAYLRTKIISQLPSKPFLQQTLAPYLPQYIFLLLS